MVRLDVPLKALAEASDKLDRIAERVAKAGSTDSPEISQADSLDLSHEAVSLMEVRNQYMVTLRTLQTADDLTRQTIDLLA